MGVDRTALNNWLTGRYVPSGEVALQLLEWATAEESQQKRDPGGVSAPPGQMAQQRKSTTNEKPKPSRRKASGKTPPTSTLKRGR